MTLVWAIIAVIVLMALSAVLPVLMRFFWAFGLAVTVLLALHARTHPGEAIAGYAGLGVLMVGRNPLLRLLRL